METCSNRGKRWPVHCKVYLPLEKISYIGLDWLSEKPCSICRPMQSYFYALAGLWLGSIQTVWAGIYGGNASQAPWKQHYHDTGLPFVAGFIMGYGSREDDSSQNINLQTVKDGGYYEESSIEGKKESKDLQWQGQ